MRLPLLALPLLLGCSSFLYYPTSNLYINPKGLKYSPEEIVFHDTNDEKLVAWHFSASSEPEAIIVFFHGNAQNISSHFQSLYWVLDHNYDFFIFDYPGYGPSQGVPTPKSTLESGLKAVDYVQEKWPDLPIVIFGQSLGGAVALRTLIDLPNKENICFISVESSFLSYKKAGRSALSKHWITWPLQLLPYIVLSDRYAPKQDVSKISPIPIYIIHNKSDPIVDVSLGKEIYKKAKEPKELWLIEEGGHIDAFFARRDNLIQKKFLEKLAECHLN